MYKSGAKLGPVDYPEIKGLTLFAKMFEMAFHGLLIFVNEAFSILGQIQRRFPERQQSFR